MSLTKNEVLNELHNGGIITLGAIGISMASKKLLKDDLEVSPPKNFMNILKMSLAFGTSSVLIRYAQKMNWIPENPFK